MLSLKTANWKIFGEFGWPRWTHWQRPLRQKSGSRHLLWHSWPILAGTKLKIMESSYRQWWLTSYAFWRSPLLRLDLLIEGMALAWLSQTDWALKLTIWVTVARLVKKSFSLKNNFNIYILKNLCTVARVELGMNKLVGVANKQEKQTKQNPCKLSLNWNDLASRASHF